MSTLFSPSSCASFMSASKPSWRARQRAAAVLLVGCAAAAAALSQAAAPTPPPSGWDARYWQQAMEQAAAARARGERLQAEAWCAHAIPWAEAQALPALRAYEAFLQGQAGQPGSAGDVARKADLLERSHAERQRSPQGGSSYLGFAPDQELRAFAAALQQVGDGERAAAMQALAQAYRRGQTVALNRSLLLRDGKDPRGEC